MSNPQIKILFVCLGNICRSPMAEFLMYDKLVKAKLSEIVEVASSGTAGYHNGQFMHKGTAAILKRENIDPSSFVSSQVYREDLDTYDLILAMDNDNIRDLKNIFATNSNEKIKKITEFSQNSKLEMIPDPWYTGDFEETFQLLTDCCDGLLAKIKEDLS